MKIVQASFRIPQLLLHRLHALAKKERTEVDQLLGKIVEEYLDAGDVPATDIHAYRHELPGIEEKLKKGIQEEKEEAPEEGPVYTTVLTHTPPCTATETGRRLSPRWRPVRSPLWSQRNL
jgi:hypothetical protein